MEKSVVSSLVRSISAELTGTDSGKREALHGTGLYWTSSSIPTQAQVSSRIQAIGHQDDLGSFG